MEFSKKLKSLQFLIVQDSLNPIITFLGEKLLLLLHVGFSVRFGELYFIVLTPVCAGTTLFSRMILFLNGIKANNHTINHAVSNIP